MIFFELLYKILPLYVLTLMGYLSGSWLKTDRKSIAEILFFMITPVVIFGGVTNARLDMSILCLPFLTFVISSFLCVLFYHLSKCIWSDSTCNLVAISAGSGNTGFFGLPVALLLFDNQGEAIYIMAMLGITIYESTLGFYILAKGTYTARECFYKLIKLPTLYAFILGLIVNLSHLQVPKLFLEFSGYMKGTYTVLGMMLVGLGLHGINKFKIDYKYVGMTFLAKFFAWPLITFFVIACDSLWLSFFNQTIYDALLLISIVPLAVNTIALASILKSHPEKAAVAVILSTAFALVYIPFMTAYFIHEKDISKKTHFVLS